MRPRISVCPSARWSIRWSIGRSVCQSVRNPFFFEIAKTRVSTSVGERKARGRQGEGKREVEGGGGGMEGSGGGVEGGDKGENALFDTARDCRWRGEVKVIDEGGKEKEGGE